MAAALLAAGVGALPGCDGSALGEQPGRAISPGAAETTAGGVDPRAASVSAPRRTDWTAGGCPVPSDSPRAPIGKSAGQLVREYGPTKSDVRFILGEAMDPVSMALRNVLSSPADLRREVRRQAWERAGCELRVWSVVREGGWTAFASYRAPAGGEH